LLRFILHYRRGGIPRVTIPFDLGSREGFG
jgi:hypothetical protein